MEQAVGFQLFTRTRNQLSPTPETYQYHVSVARLIGQFQALEQEGRAIASRQVVSVVVAAQPVFCDTFLLDVIARCSLRDPPIKVALVDVGQEQMLQMLAAGACDFGIGITLGTDRFSVDVEPVAACGAACIVPEDHPAAAASVVPLPRLRNDRFIDLPIGSPLRLRVDAMMQAAGIQRETIAEARKVRGVAELVARGVVDGIVRLLDFPGLVIRPLIPNVSWDIAILTATATPRRPEVDVVLAETRAELARLVEQVFWAGCQKRASLPVGTYHQRPLACR